MILALRTSDRVCHVWVDGHEYVWEADRTLARGLLGYLEECLSKDGKRFSDITGLAVYRGPGSFTGLRIGITVMNTIAASEGVPIVGETGDDWLERAASRLGLGDDDRLVLPEYGADAHVTAPKK